MSGRGSGTGPGPRDKNPPGTRSPNSPPEKPPDDPPATAQGESCPLRRVVRVVNPNGLHPRLADRFIRTLKQYTCTVTLWSGELRADGANIWDIIAIAVMPDSDVILEVDGPDATRAVDVLAEILGSPGGEDYTI